MQFPQALHQRDFRIYVFGNFFALNAMWILRVTIGWVGWEMTGQASFVGILTFLNLVPTFLAGPLFGVMADRVDVRRAAFTIQSMLAVSAALFTGLWALGAITPLPLAGFALAIGMITSAHHPVRLSMAPRLVPPEMIGSAIPVVSINFNICRFIGPFVAGAVIAAFGAGAAMAVSTALFIPLLVALTGIHPREQAPRERRDSVWRSLVEGARHAARTRMIATGMALTALSSVTARGVQEILPVVADGVFARGPSGLGQMTAAAGAGAVLVSVWLASSPGTPGRIPARAIVGAWLSLALVIALGLVPSWWLALIVTLGLGATGTMTGVSIQSAIQMALTDDLRGRVMSLWVMLAIGSIAFGSLGLGALTDWIGLTAALSLATGASALLMIAPSVIALRGSLPVNPPPAAEALEPRRHISQP